MKNLIDKKRSQRIRRKLKLVNKNRPRLSVFRSSKNISAQIIDDKNNKTLVSASSVEKEVKMMKKKKTDLSVIIAERLAKKALEKKITKIFFDRSHYKYHGRIKTLAETLRKNGMEF